MWQVTRKQCLAVADFLSSTFSLHGLGEPGLSSLRCMGWWGSAYGIQVGLLLRKHPPRFSTRFAVLLNLQIQFFSSKLTVVLFSFLQALDPILLFSLPCTLPSFTV